jgi:hypothetical protein
MTNPELKQIAWSTRQNTETEEIKFFRNTGITEFTMLKELNRKAFQNS